MNKKQTIEETNKSKIKNLGDFQLVMFSVALVFDFIRSHFVCYYDDSFLNIYGPTIILVSASILALISQRIFLSGSVLAKTTGKIAQSLILCYFFGKAIFFLIRSKFYSELLSFSEMVLYVALLLSNHITDIVIGMVALLMIIQYFKNQNVTLNGNK